jgi:uncharacterized protein YjcR
MSNSDLITQQRKILYRCPLTETKQIIMYIDVKTNLPHFEIETFLTKESHTQNVVSECEHSK